MNTIEVLHSAAQRFEAIGSWHMASIIRKMIADMLKEMNCEEWK